MVDSNDLIIICKLESLKDSIMISMQSNNVKTQPH